MPTEAHKAEYMSPRPVLCEGSWLEDAIDLTQSPILTSTPPTVSNISPSQLPFNQYERQTSTTQASLCIPNTTVTMHQSNAQSAKKLLIDPIIMSIDEVDQHSSRLTTDAGILNVAISVTANGVNSTTALSVAQPRKPPASREKVAAQRQVHRASCESIAAVDIFNVRSEKPPSRTDYMTKHWPGQYTAEELAKKAEDAAAAQARRDRGYAAILKTKPFSDSGTDDMEFQDEASRAPLSDEACMKRANSAYAQDRQVSPPVANWNDRQITPEEQCNETNRRCTFNKLCSESSFPEHIIKELVFAEEKIDFAVKITFKIADTPRNSTSPSLLFASSQVKNFDALRTILANNFSRDILRLIRPSFSVVIDGVDIVATNRAGFRGPATTKKIDTIEAYELHINALTCSYTNFKPYCSCDECGESAKFSAVCYCGDCGAFENVPEIIVYLLSYGTKVDPNHLRQSGAAQMAADRPDLVIQYKELVKEDKDSGERFGEHGDRTEPKIIIGIKAVQHLIEYKRYRQAREIREKKELMLETAKLNKELKEKDKVIAKVKAQLKKGHNIKTTLSKKRKSGKTTRTSPIAAAGPDVLEAQSSAVPVNLMPAAQSSANGPQYTGYSDEDGDTEYDDQQVEEEVAEEEFEEDTNDDEDIWVGRKIGRGGNRKPPKKCQKANRKRPEMEANAVASSRGAANAGLTSEDAAAIRAAQLDDLGLRLRA